MSAASPIVATVDRIEEGAAGERLAVLVFDDGQQLVVPIERLPDGTRAGSVLRLVFAQDPDEQARRREEIRRLQRRLFGEGR